MGTVDSVVDQPVSVLTVECREPGGPIVRTVTEGVISFERINYLWEKLSQFDTLFNDFVRGDFSRFVQHFVKQDAAGNPMPTGLVWDVDDVGIFFLTEMMPLNSGLAHFVFWDKRFRGREELCRKMLKMAFDELQFHRIRVEVPLYANFTIQAVERIGFTLEGRQRQAIKYKGDWFDVNMYSMLAEEM